MIEVLTTQEFDHWLRRLKDHQGCLRILSRLDRLAAGNFGDVKPVGGGVMELRLAFGPGYRVHLTRRDDQLVMLLCGGGRSSQSDGITRAGQLAAEWNEKEGDDE